MALPAIRSLAACGDLVVHAKPGLHDLFVGLPVRPPGRIEADVAVLFTPSLRAAWEARQVPEVVGTPTDHRTRWLTRQVPERTSRAGTFAALARAAGGEPVGAPRYEVRGTVWSVPRHHTAIFPLVGGGRNRRWDGFRVLADRLPGPVVFYGGPGEDEAIRAIAGSHLLCLGASLPDLAATLQRADRVVAGDTGPAHLARAVGRPTLVVHTSTTPARTGPDGAVSVHGPALGCRPCQAATCVGPEPLACLAVSVDDVLAALGRLR